MDLDTVAALRATLDAAADAGGDPAGLRDQYQSALIELGLLNSTAGPRPSSSAEWFDWQPPTRIATPLALLVFCCLCGLQMFAEFLAGRLAE